jgi:regulator of RNase E activity RraA
MVSIEMMRERLYSAVVCDALDAVGRRQQAPRVAVRPMTSETVLVGRAKTTLWAEMFHTDPKPYELELQAVDSAQPDDVLIAAAGGSMRSGLWGELLSTAARRSGCVGAIVDGAVRDVRQMTAMKFPVWARGTSVYDSRDRHRVIDVDVEVEIDGVTIAPGDLVFADVDGVVVVPRDVEDQVIQRAWEKVQAENVVRDSIRSGMTATEAFDRYGVL